MIKTRAVLLRQQIMLCKLLGTCVCCSCKFFLNWIIEFVVSESIGFQLFKKKNKEVIDYNRNSACTDFLCAISFSCDKWFYSFVFVFQKFVYKKLLFAFLFVLYLWIICFFFDKSENIWILLWMKMCIWINYNDLIKLKLMHWVFLLYNWNSFKQKIF